MISGFSNERVSYNRTRYLNFPSTLTENVPSISKPTVHVIKIRFNNIFKNEKALFAAISVSLSLISLFIGYALYSWYQDFSADEMVSAQNTAAIEELKSIQAEDAGITVMNKSTYGAPSGASEQGGNYLSFNNGGGTDPGSLLMASNNQGTQGKEVLTSKRAVVDIDEKTSVNPFLPVSDIQETKTVKKVVKPNPNYILPPTTLGVNSPANLLLQTSISGIMYDSYNPSAIIKIRDTDYLVRKGDEINGYKVLNIQPKTVTVKLGANVFEAPIGIILANLHGNNNTSTVNLNTRFGGPYNKR